VTWHGSTEIASGKGERGPWRQNDSRYDYVDDATVAISQEGTILVAWVDQARKDIFLQRFAAKGAEPLSPPFNVSRSPAIFSWLPRVVVAPGSPRNVFLLWQEIIFSGGSHGGDILFARSEDGGVSFSQPINLSQSIGGEGKGRINKDVWHNGSLDVAAGADGSVYAAWTEYDGPLWFSVSRDGGESFSRPRQLAGEGEANPARGPALALAPDGAVYLAWTVGEDKAADIHVAKSTDRGGTFGKARIVARTRGYSDAPKLAVDREGVVHLVYGESPDGPFGLHRVYYTRSKDGAESFATPSEISRPMPDSSRGAGYPALNLDARGNLYVTWELFQRPGSRPRGLGFAVSLDGGANFTAPVAVPDSSDPAGGLNGSHQGLLMNKLAVSGAGAVAIVNSSLKPGEHSRVWLIRGELPRATAR
jgi:hypothetical protein